MDENTKKEEFSYGYIHVLTSACGYIIQRSGRSLDNCGIDLQIIDSETSENAEAPRISAQTKCTTPKYLHEEENCFKYDLKVANYNQLIKKAIDPNILIVVIVPDEISDWLNICEKKQESLLKTCGYWVSLEGKEKTLNTRTTRIKIPKANILTLEALKIMMISSQERRKKLFGLE